MVTMRSPGFTGTSWYCFLISLQISCLAGCSPKQETANITSSANMTGELEEKEVLNITFSEEKEVLNITFSEEKEVLNISSSEQHEELLGEISQNETLTDFVSSQEKLSVYKSDVMSDSLVLSPLWPQVKSSSFIIVTPSERLSTTSDIQPSRSQSYEDIRPTSSQLKSSQSRQLDDTITSTVLLSASLISVHLTKETVSFTAPQPTSSVIVRTTRLSSAGNLTQPGTGNISYDDTQISNEDLHLGLRPESHIDQQDLTINKTSESAGQLNTSLEVNVNTETAVTDVPWHDVEQFIELKSSRPTDDELLSLSHTNNFNYRVEKLENNQLDNNQLDNGDEIELDLLNFETTTQSELLQPQTETRETEETTWKTLNSVDEVDQEFFTKENDLETDWTYPMETSTADKEEITLGANINEATKPNSINIEGPAEEVAVVGEIVTSRADVKEPISIAASGHDDSANITKRNKNLKVSGLQFFELPKTYYETAEDHVMKSARYFRDVIDNEISETNLEDVKVSPAYDTGKEVSLTINITEYSKVREAPDSPGVSRQGYAPPSSPLPPLAAEESPLPPSCFTSTGCTATCGPGFELLLPNTMTAGCQTGALQVVPCDLGACPERCVWSSWSTWSDCERASPGEQDCTQARRREVARQETGGGAPCQGEASEARFCVSQTCQGNNYRPEMWQHLGQSVCHVLASSKVCIIQSVMALFLNIYKYFESHPTVC